MVLSLISDMLKAIAEYAKHDRAEFVRVVQEAQSSQQTTEVRQQRTRLATGKQKEYEERTKSKKKAEIKARKATIRTGDIAKGVFIQISNLPQRKLQKGAKTA